MPRILSMARRMSLTSYSTMGGDSGRQHPPFGYALLFTDEAIVTQMAFSYAGLAENGVNVARNALLGVQLRKRQEEDGH